MKTMHFKTIILLLFLSSCTSSQYVLLNPVDKKSPDIEIYLKNIKKPTKEFEVIAHIETTGSIFTNQKQLIKGLKKKAEKINGNAIIEVEFFYIPWVLSSLPSVKGVVVIYK